MLREIEISSHQATNLSHNIARNHLQLGLVGCGDEVPLHSLHVCQRRTGERKKKSVRGCIVASDISILNLVVVQKGEGEIEGLTDEQRRGRIAEIARGLNHWAIPQEEKMHLLVTSHHGLRQGAKKEKGEKALCACCLRNGHRIEETAQHEHHDCPTARAVWRFSFAI